MSATTTHSVTVTIPIRLDRALSPNSRGHWSKRHRANQEARQATDYAMRAALDLNDPEACFQTARWPLTLHYLVAYGKGQRRLDDDNAIASMKPIRDQIAACLGIDDRHFTTGSMTQTRDPDGLGFVKVAIESEAGND